MNTIKNTEPKKKNFRRFIFLQLFIIYLIVLIYLCFFSETFGRFSHESVAINLVPFREISRFFVNIETLGFTAFFVNIFGNIAAFLPFGFFEASYFGDGRIVKATIFSCFFSILIELMQLLTTVGTCDIDDVILNTVGAFIGAFIYTELFKEKPEAEENEGR